MTTTASWPGDPVLVLGAGPVGQTTALLLARAKAHALGLPYADGDAGLTVADCP